MPPLRSGPKPSPARPLGLGFLASDFPERAFDLLALFGYVPYDWQREKLTSIYADRSKCAPLYYVQVARKNGKTALAVMVALIELCLFDDRHIYAVSDSQTNLSCVFWLEFMARLSRQSDHFIVRQLAVENPATGSFIRMRPGNFSASQGINPHLVIVDEVHLMSREIWHGYLMAGDAREGSLLFGVTTPGYNLDCAAFDLYNEAKMGATDSDLNATIFEPSDPGCDPSDATAWEESNPALHEIGSLRPALVRHARRMPENDFRRFRLGQWTQTQNAWLPFGAFAAVATGSPIPNDAAVWLALDGSWSGDTTGLVACSTSPVLLEVIDHWYPPVMDGGHWRVPIADVETAIRNAMIRFPDLVEIVCDPSRWSRTLQSLADEGIPIVEYPQSPQRMIPATLAFYEAVMDQKVGWYQPTGQGLAAHVNAAETKQSDAGVMLKKPAFAPAMQHIDLAVCAVMAHDRATRGREMAEVDVHWVGFTPASTVTTL